jgi:hypothetical protein
MELRPFEFFCRRTARELPGFFHSGFWEHVVLQLSCGEPAILNAAIALGALHEAEEANDMSLSREHWPIMVIASR